MSAARERFASTELVTLDAYADYFAARAELEYALGSELEAGGTGSGGPGDDGPHADADGGSAR